MLAWKALWTIEGDLLTPLITVMADLMIPMLCRNWESDNMMEVSHLIPTQESHLLTSPSPHMSPENPKFEG